MTKRCPICTRVRGAKSRDQRQGGCVPYVICNRCINSVPSSAFPVEGKVAETARRFDALVNGTLVDPHRCHHCTRIYDNGPDAVKCGACPARVAATYMGLPVHVDVRLPRGTIAVVAPPVAE